MAKRKSALGGNYQSAFMAGRAGSDTPVLPDKGGAVRRAYKPVTRPKCSLYLLPDVLERARDAADFLSGPPERLTLTALVEQAVNREIERLAKKHNHGKPFPARSADLRRGSRS